MKKFCEFLRENKKSIIDLKNGTIDKRRTKIPSRYKNLLHLWKIAQIVRKSEIIIIIQENIEVQHVVFLI